MILDFWLGKCLIPDGQFLLSHGLNSSNLTNENHITWSHFDRLCHHINLTPSSQKGKLSTTSHQSIFLAAPSINPTKS